MKARVPGFGVGVVSWAVTGAEIYNCYFECF